MISSRRHLARTISAPQSPRRACVKAVVVRKPVRYTPREIVSVAYRLLVESYTVQLGVTDRLCRSEDAIRSAPTEKTVAAASHVLLGGDRIRCSSDLQLNAVLARVAISCKQQA